MATAQESEGARKFAYKLTFNILENIFMNHPRVFRTEE
jgi:hypothetical protein